MSVLIDSKIIRPAMGLKWLVSYQNPGLSVMAEKWLASTILVLSNCAEIRSSDDCEGWVRRNLGWKMMVHLAPMDSKVLIITLESDVPIQVREIHVRMAI